MNATLAACTFLLKLANLTSVHNLYANTLIADTTAYSSFSDEAFEQFMRVYGNPLNGTIASIMVYCCRSNNDGSNMIKVYNIEKRKSIRLRDKIMGGGYKTVREPKCIAYVYYIPLRVLSSAGLSVEQKSRHFVLTKAGAPVRK